MLSDERQPESLMKLGAGLAFFGLACPFFWLSFLTGNSSVDTWVNGIHSGIFVLIGLAFLGKGWYDLRRVRAGIPVKSPE